MDDAELLIERGKVEEAITTLTETAADAIEIAPFAELSRARIAAYRITTIGVPAERLSDPWGDPTPPQFDLDLLPPVLRYFASAKARSIGSDAAAVAWSALAICSGALNGSIRLQMKPRDTGFLVPPGIWMLLVGEPSSQKSPALRSAYDLLSQVQAKRFEKWQRAHADWQAEDEKTRDPEPFLEQLYTSDTTQEGIRDLLSRQDRGIIVFNDEWGGVHRRDGQVQRRP
jgi:hypothetical protein